MRELKERGQGQTNAAEEGGRGGTGWVRWGGNYSQLLQFKKSKAAKINKTLFQTNQHWSLQ